MDEKLFGVPQEQVKIFLFLARTGQAIASKETTENPNKIIGELKRYLYCKLTSKNLLFEYFLQGYIPEIKKRFEEAPFLNKKNEWTPEWQERYVKVGRTQFDFYYKQEIEPLLI